MSDSLYMSKRELRQNKARGPSLIAAKKQNRNIPVGIKTSIKRRKDVLHIRRKVVEYWSILSAFSTDLSTENRRL